MKIILIAAVWMLSLLGLQAQSLVILQTGADGKTTVTGDKSLLTGYYPPASTFKELIAWAAFKQGVARPGTLHRCQDQGENEVNMAEAMFASSNDYFNWLATQLDRDKFDALIQKNSWGGKKFHSGIWLAGGPESAAHGGALTVTVEQVHALSVKFLNEPQNRESDYMRKVLRRPPTDDRSMVFGKSGAWGGAVWMTGFYDPLNEPGKRKVVTVFVPYTAPAWKPAKAKALAEFYRCIGVPEPMGP